MRAPVVLLIALGLLLLPSCASDEDEPGGSATTAATVADAEGTGLPADLRGTWRLQSDEIPEPVRLVLRDGGYTISRGGASGSGAVAVEGDELVFSDSNLCDGVGRYRWSVEGDRLGLERIEEACSGRAPVLEGATYTRSG